MNQKESNQSKKNNISNKQNTCWGPEDNQDNRVQSGNKKRKRVGVPVFWAIVIDVIIAAMGLYLFSLYYFILPRDLSQNALALPTPKSTLQKVYIDVPQPTEHEPAAVSQDVIPPMEWGDKFDGKFTDGAVEQTENSYKSAYIAVTVDSIQKNGVAYYVADIYITDLKYFKTAFANDTFGSGIYDKTDTIAKKNNAVIAINGDYCGTNAGPVVRNGILYRDETYKDVLVMYYDGSMKTFTSEEFDINQIKNEGAYQVFTFGPMLLKDGQPMEEFNSSVYPGNPRTAVGYYEPGHYCFVVVDGRQPGYSKGYTLKEMSYLFYELGCKVAFNMDGGQSSEMAFLGNLVNQPYKGGRGTSDILYIAEK
ncbi:MAG: phosphodiester glycosidase family protein [Christensenellales bacterium]